MLRKICVFLHRYGGLGMAGFLVVVGLTGSLLAFNIELERLFAPQLFANAPPVLAPLDLATLAERAQALVPQARLIYLAHTAPDQTKAYFEPLENPETQAPYDLDFTEFFVDPFTGAELGRRRNADLSQGAINLMPFIYDLHWRLVLGGFRPMDARHNRLRLDDRLFCWLLSDAASYDDRLLAPLETSVADQARRQFLPAQFRSPSRRRPVALGNVVRLRLVKRDDGHAAADLRMADGLPFRLHLANRRL